ncbi:NOI-like protein [Elaeis guineensis]|uniref:NOI-like protein n=1 Tax=Elaeis guineensis var. tenera TaxID=51953 RepID=A0A6J0PM99_ELAGV|nr:NOI-like protein [Elaeis guineensis]
MPPRPRSVYRPFRRVTTHKDYLPLPVSASQKHLLFGTTMAQHAHIPKFGNWDSENIPYTAHFETALKDKDAGSKIFNPNDPEENPQAYNPRTYAQDHQRSDKHRNDTPTDYRAVKQHRKKHHSMEDGEFQGSMKAPLHHRPTFQGVNMGRQRSRNLRSSVSVSSSDKISSNNSPAQPRQHRISTKDLAEGSHGFSSSLHYAVAKTGNSREGMAQQHRATLVPRFGFWDEKDPKSAEGFTVIFNRVKEEKHMASTRLPTLPAKPIACPVGQNDYCHASSKSRMWCCLWNPAAE